MTACQQQLALLCCAPTPMHPVFPRRDRNPRARPWQRTRLHHPRRSAGSRRRRRACPQAGRRRRHLHIAAGTCTCLAARPTRCSASLATYSFAVFLPFPHPPDFFPARRPHTQSTHTPCIPDVPLLIAAPWAHQESPLRVARAHPAPPFVSSSQGRACGRRRTSQCAPPHRPWPDPHPQLAPVRHLIPLHMPDPDDTFSMSAPRGPAAGPPSPSPQSPPLLHPT